MPLICPATIIEAVKRPLPCWPFSSWVSRTVSRSSLPASTATWNIVGSSSSELCRSSGVLVRSSRRLITAWVVARLPAVISAIVRSPGTVQWNILRNTEMLSTPELVWVSLISTSPRSSTIPTQYVIVHPVAASAAPRETGAVPLLFRAAQFHRQIDRQGLGHRAEADSGHRSGVAIVAPGGDPD